MHRRIYRIFKYTCIFFAIVFLSFTITIYYLLFSFIYHLYVTSSMLSFYYYYHTPIILIIYFFFKHHMLLLFIKQWFQILLSLHTFLFDILLYSLYRSIRILTCGILLHLLYYFLALIDILLVETYVYIFLNDTSTLSFAHTEFTLYFIHFRFICFFADPIYFFSFFYNFYYTSIIQIFYYFHIYFTIRFYLLLY